jgi:hypothetical protein
MVHSIRVTNNIVAVDVSTFSQQAYSLPHYRVIDFLSFVMRVELWGAMMSCCKVVIDSIKVHFRQNAIPNS